MSKRKYSLLNYIESEESSYNKGLVDGETLAKNLKKDTSFNFKSYLDGLCNGYTLEFKSIKQNNEIPINFTSSTDTLTLQDYINHERSSYSKGTNDGKLIAKNSNNQFINFKSFLDGVCNGYTSYDNSLLSKSINFFNFGFNNSDCLLRSSSNQLENDDNQ